MANASVFAQLGHFCCKIQRAAHLVIHPANRALDPLLMTVQDVIAILLW